jgi:hypothetical protein
MLTSFPTHRSLGRALAAAAGALTLAASTAACGSTGHSASGNESQQGRPAGNAYSSSLVAIVSPSDQALARYDREARSLGPTATGARITQAVSPVLTAFELRDTKLLEVDWPPGTTTAVHDLVDEDGILTHDLQALEQASPAQVPAIVATVATDQQHDQAAAQAARRVLQGVSAQ